jgi:hypothetical protein
MPDENGKPIWKSMTCWGAALLGVALAWMGYDSVPEGFIAEFTANVDRYILGVPHRGRWPSCHGPHHVPTAEGVGHGPS